MTGETTGEKLSRREEMARARASRRPSRLGRPAGATAHPDRMLDPAAGFPELLAQVWKQALTAPDIGSAVSILLTLDGHVPADIQLRALTGPETAALRVIDGMSSRPHEVSETSGPTASSTTPAFIGELGLTTTGRVAIGVPAAGPLTERYDLVDGVLRVPWDATGVSDFVDHLEQIVAEQLDSVRECREWLCGLSPQERGDLLDELIDAARRTAPFVLYQEDKLYTNFRERNNLTGKTLFAGHPDCVLSTLREMPPTHWPDNDVMVVACLTLLIRSGTYARIEEANGTQLRLSAVGELLERTRRTYNSAGTGAPISPAADARIGTLSALAQLLGRRRAEVAGSAQLYRVIHGPLMHKIEQLAQPIDATAQRLEAAVCARLRDRLPLRGQDLTELGACLADAPTWLIQPHRDFGTGLESLIYETVAAAQDCFGADFAMSRGHRALSRLIEALRAEDWAAITGWELPDYFCCVVPAPHASRYFGGSPAQLADIAWSMSARMQYNSWHFLPGNLPRTPEVLARDFFVPPSMPDIAHYSDQHHHGHVAAHVRFSIRSPQAVDIAGRRFGGFIDLRLLRCESNPFTEQELLAAQRISAFIAAATGRAAALAIDHPVTITAFDSSWHWSTVTAAAPGASDAQPRCSSPIEG